MALTHLYAGLARFHQIMPWPTVPVKRDGRRWPLNVVGVVGYEVPVCIDRNPWGARCRLLGSRYFDGQGPPTPAHVLKRSWGVANTDVLEPVMLWGGTPTGGGVNPFLAAQDGRGSFAGPGLGHLPTPVEKLAVDSVPGAVPGTALGAAVCGFDNRSGSDIARSFPVVPFTLEGLDA